MLQQYPIICCMKTGINTVTRRNPDGSVRRQFYHRESGNYLGDDKEKAIQAALDVDATRLPRVALSMRIPEAAHDHRLALGEAGELLVRAELLAAGLIVCAPSPGAAYDFAVDDGIRFWRVQVKTRMIDSSKQCQFFLFARGKGVKPTPRNYGNYALDGHATIG